jgi:peptidoglycan hydrolase CwlO-like protein
MSQSVIVEILLAVLTLAIGIGSFVGASRANSSQAAGMKASIDAAAYERAKQIYESAIDTLQEQIQGLRDHLNGLDDEIGKLQVNNRNLMLRISELQQTNDQLTTQLSNLRKNT